MQICELQKVEDFGVVFDEDLAGPLSEEQAAVLEGAASGEQTAEAEGAASDAEVVEDAPVPPGVGEQADRHGDTTEESSDADVDGGPTMASPVRPPLAPTRAPMKTRSLSVTHPLRFRRFVVSLLCTMPPNKSMAACVKS